MSESRARLPGERVFALALVGLSAFLLWQAWSIAGFTSITSAGAYPMVAAAVMLVCALSVVRSTWDSAAQPAQSNESHWGHFLRSILPGVLVQFVVAIALYMGLMERAGFIVSSYLFLVASMAILGSRRWVLNLWVSALSLALVYAVFQTVFSVVLPTGTWWQGVLK